jgi:hypothetical protein
VAKEAASARCSQAANQDTPVSIDFEVKLVALYWT